MIKTLVRENVGEPEQWAAAGGTQSSVGQLNGQLVVKTSSANHQQVQALIAQLRKTHSEQVRMEFRWLEVDIVSLRKLAEKWKHHLPTDGHAVSSALLDGKIVGKWLEDKRVKSLATRTMTVPNGQKGDLAVMQQFSYISGYEKAKQADAKSPYEPVLSVANDGIAIKAKAMIGTQRRYITMMLNPRISRKMGPNEYVPYQDAPAELKKVVTLFVEKPNVKQAQWNITMVIPDKYWLALRLHTAPGLLPKGRTTVLLVRSTIILPSTDEKLNRPGQDRDQPDSKSKDGSR